MHAMRVQNANQSAQRTFFCHIYILSATGWPLCPVFLPVLDQDRPPNGSRMTPHGGDVVRDADMGIPPNDEDTAAAAAAAGFLRQEQERLAAAHGTVLEACHAPGGEVMATASSTGAIQVWAARQGGWSLLHTEQVSWRRRIVCPPCICCFTTLQPTCCVCCCCSCRQRTTSPHSWSGQTRSTGRCWQSAHALAACTSCRALCLPAASAP